MPMGATGAQPDLWDLGHRASAIAEQPGFSEKKQGESGEKPVRPPKCCWKNDLGDTGKIYGRGCDQDGWDHV